jgi:hypothetical protein
VFILNGIAYRINAYSQDMHDLCISGQIEEYRRCSSKAEAKELCNIYNRKGDLKR